MKRGTAVWVSVAAAGALAAVAAYRWRGRSLHFGGNGRLTQDRTRLALWRFDRQFATLPPGKVLRVELSSPGIVHWTFNQWDSAEDTRTIQVDRVLPVAELPTAGLEPGARVQFTFYWPQAGRWEGEDFLVRIAEAAQSA
jgi:glucoamylase